MAGFAGGSHAHILFCGAVVQTEASGGVGEEEFARIAVDALGLVGPSAVFAICMAWITGVVPRVGIECRIAGGGAGVVGVEIVFVLAGHAGHDDAIEGAGAAIESDGADFAGAGSRILIVAFGARFYAHVLVKIDKGPSCLAFCAVLGVSIVALRTGGVAGVAHLPHIISPVSGPAAGYTGVAAYAHHFVPGGAVDTGSAVKIELVGA